MQETYPLTETQLGMLLEWNRHPAGTQYNVAFIHTLPTTVDDERLERALKLVLGAHGVYRTRFVEEAGEVRQFSDPALELPIVRQTMDEAEARRLGDTLNEPFDPFTGPLARFRIVRSSAAVRLVVEIFHLITDGSSVCAFNAELDAAYRTGEAPAAEPVPFAEYAAAEKATFALEPYRTAAAAAAELFAGKTMTVPAADTPAGAPADGAYFAFDRRFPRAAVENFCRVNSLAPHLFYAGAFARTLALYAGEREAVFFTVNHGRREARLKTTHGALVKTVPVLGVIDGDRPLADYLASFRLHGAGDYPFTHFCRDLGLTPGWGFVYQERTRHRELTLDGYRSVAEEPMSGGAGEMPVVQIIAAEGEVIVRITAAGGRYGADFLQGFIARLETVIANFAAAAGSTRLAAIPTLTAAEIAAAVRVARGEELDYDRSLTFVDIFRRTARGRGASTAVVDAGRTLAYGELDARSDALAAHLAALGVRRGGFVGLMLPRTVDFPLAAIAVEKCGAGYVPLDGEYPRERLAYMLEDSRSQVLVTTRALAADKALAFSGATVLVDEFDFAPAAAPAVAPTPDDPAYMIYTSGSTGRPKGVVVPQRALVAMLTWMVRDFALGPAKRNLAITSFSFDASVPDLFPPLAAGGELHILPEEARKDLAAIRDYAVKVGATGLTTSTQLGLALVNAYPELPLEYMMLGGEKMVAFAKTPVRVLNGYGPTEFAVCSSYHEVDQSRSYDIPVGRAVPNTWSLIVDRLGQLAPPDLAGEIALAGPQLADGYWRLPEKTAAAFVPTPPLAGVELPERMYLTGDLARYDANGELVFLGRRDFQVKLRGFRIEIGEIEHAASRCPGVGAVAAEVRTVAGAKHLVLYYEGTAASEELKAHLAETLTAYMVPEFFVAMPKLPLTPNGKIDRRALPAPELVDEVAVKPADALESRIFAAVADTLQTDGFGVTHDFSRLGLTSLGAMTLIAKLKRDAGLVFTMKDLVAAPTVRELAALAAKRTAAPAAEVRRRPKRRTYPMTENQRGIYADWLRSPTGLQYNVPVVLRFADVDAAALAAAATKVLGAHPALKVRFVEHAGEIVQERRDEYALNVEVEPLAAEPDAAFFAAAMRPFAPDADCLARGRVYAAPAAAYLFLDIHHTVFDGFSTGIVLAEIRRALAGEEIAPEGYTAFDAALDERDYLESELAEEDLSWFERHLEGRESTALEASAAGAEGAEGELGRVAVTLDAAPVMAAAARLGVTASDWFLAAFTELLRRIGRSDKVLVNFVTAGRSTAEAQGAVGMFVKTLPLMGVADAANFGEVVRRIHAEVAQLIDRERVSFVRLSERLGLRPDILFAFEGGIFELGPGVEIVPVPLKVAKAPLSAVVTPRGGEFEFALEYDRSRYADRQIALVAGMLRTLALAAAAHGSDEPLGALELVDADEAAAVLALARGEALEYDATRTFVNLVRAQAITRPDALALVDCERTLTYGELEARANALGRRLLELGVRSGAFVGLMLPRRVGFPVALLAVQKCGAGYVPLDSDYPADRLAYMLANSRAQVLITTRELFSGKGIEFSGTVLFLEEFDFTAAPAAAELNCARPDTPAYMIYTSGSTGRPKGVVVPQRALRHLCAWSVEKLALRPGSRIATHPSFSFDASVMDIFPTLAAGGELHIYGEELRKDLPGLREYIVGHAIEGGVMSTQIGMTLLDTYPDLPLRYLVVGGEKLMPIAPTAVTIVNGYGPTEFTVCSSYQVVDQSQAGDIPIGRAVPGTYSLIVDREGQLLPRGFAGELALAGPQLADGYWQLPEKTAATFVATPPLAGVELPERMYRTGDLARYNDAGTLAYMGRLDFQVKLRGFRIEIGEIEHRAAEFAGVQGVAAEVREVGGAQHLVLYYGAQAQLDEAALRAHLAAALADYMVPDYFVRVDPLPLTPNGKINRKLLKSPESAATHEYVEPATETERKIADVYAAVLKAPRYGATDDFFAMGGTSLIGIKAVVALQKAGLEVAYGDLFRYQTPRALAAFLTGAAPAAAADAAAAGRFDYADYDYEAIDRLLAATPTELFEGFRRHSLGDVLLCGATGYLGVHILRCLLESTDATVYALVRPKRGAGAAKRLDSQYVYYFGAKVPKRYRERLAFVEGDITDADLGAKLKDLRVGTVINCAALVKHYVADDLMDRINVGGVENLIAWCGESGARLVQMSTYSVGGTIRGDSAVALDERHLYVGQESDNDYVRTKFLAERAVLAATAAGRIRGKIMRLGNLMGRESDGEFQMNLGANAFVNSLKTYKALGAYPLAELVRKIEMSPIDRVAEACCLLATTPDDMIVFHPYNCYALDMGAVLGALNRRGLNVDFTSTADFAACVDALKADPARSSELQGILHYAGHLLSERKITPTVNDWTTTVLYRLGFRWRPAEDRYLENFFAMLEGLAVFG